ncbi:hypothetical protein SH1V18_19540 [Vallitalea longa]|uniref:Uncharacterized protein n=1 Tax=Vallitalea longa TaxID=2936439 RepID=A0A9W5YAC7_9FIRM|nr:hypothetical protein [Vallitalea longa]GKX29474.1 hypothetical protein SH1V18_19540 [Vallitalea longa]
MFSQLINKQQWIIEDAGRKSFREGMEKAEVIINLQPSILIRKKRIITRYIKQKIGLEDCLYRPSLRMLKFMFRALYDYETGRNDLDLRLNQYRDKTITLRNSRDTEEYILNVTK